MSINLEGFTRKKKKITLGGKEFVFSELSLLDFVKFRARIIEQRDETKGKRRERLIAEAEKIGGIDPLKLLEQLDKPPTDEEIEAEMETFDGLGYLAYLSLKYAYPEITIEDVMSIVSIDNIEQIASVIGGGIKDTKKKRVRKPIKKKQ